GCSRRGCYRHATTPALPGPVQDWVSPWLAVDTPGAASAGSCPDQRTRSRKLAAPACSWPLLSIGNEPCLLPCQSLNGVQCGRRTCWHIAKNHARHHGAAKGAQGRPQGKHHIRSEEHTSE